LAALGGAASPCISGIANACVIDNNLASNGRLLVLERAA